MGSTLTLSVLEIVLLFFGAIILGITIHFTISSRRNLKASMSEKDELNKQRDEWKLRYFNDVDVKDKELAALKEQLAEAEENTNIYSIEAEEMRKENKKLLAEVSENSNIYSIEMEELRKENKKLSAAVAERSNTYSNEVEELRKDNKRLLAETAEHANTYSAEMEELRKENKKLLATVTGHSNVYSTEIEELRKENKKLLEELSSAPKVVAASVQLSEKPDYMEQLRMAQASLMEHNEKINQLLGNIDAFKEKEERQREIIKYNEELSLQIAELQMRLDDKDKEISSIRKKEVLTKEMTSKLDNVYSEFNVLQSKMQKMEAQANASKLISLEYEDLKESYRKMGREFEDQKVKLNSLISEHQQLQAQLAETEEKLREANFQRQQLQKRVAYLEELNNDLQVVSDANKKLEVQLKRIGELESMLNMAAEERDQLIRKK